MAYVRIFAHARVIRLLAALCAVSALAFVLGQGAAAVRENLLIERQSATPPQVFERVTGAQGAPRPTSTPSATGARYTTQPTQAAPVKFSTGDKHTQPLTAQQPLKPKDKQHPSHKKAAGDESHGGLGHQKGDKGNQGNQDNQGNMRHNDGAQQNGAQQDTQSNQGQQGQQGQQGGHKSKD